MDVNCLPKFDNFVKANSTSVEVSIHIVFATSGHGESRAIASYVVSIVIFLETRSRYIKSVMYQNRFVLLHQYRAHHYPVMSQNTPFCHRLHAGYRGNMSINIACTFYRIIIKMSGISMDMRYMMAAITRLPFLSGCIICPKLKGKVYRITTVMHIICLLL